MLSYFFHYRDSDSVEASSVQPDTAGKRTLLQSSICLPFSPCK